MAKPLYSALFASFLLSNLAFADAPSSVDADGFTNPLKQLNFNPGLDQLEFERATINALNVYDPWEPWNRNVYHFNYRFDQWVFLPIVDGYRYVTPRFLQSGIRNFFSNLGDVSTLFNSVLQFKVERTMQTTARLLTNTIVGIGGVWDPATLLGLPRQDEDFGQTLGFYGVPAGPYLMLPLLGPSSVRDASGLVVDYIAQDQINWMNYPQTRKHHPELTLLEAVNTRASVNFRYGQLNSPFEYEKIRFVYHESRQLKIDE